MISPMQLGIVAAEKHISGPVGDRPCGNYRFTIGRLFGKHMFAYVVLRNFGRDLL